MDDIFVRNPSEYFRQLEERNDQLAAYAKSRNSMDTKTYRVMYKPNKDSDWTLGIDCGRDYAYAQSLRAKWLRSKSCFDVCIERSNSKKEA